MIPDLAVVSSSFRPFRLKINISKHPPKPHNPISCEKGSGLFHRNKKYRGIVLIVQPTIFCLGWDKDVPLITRNFN